MKESNWLLSKIILVITLAMLCFTLDIAITSIEDAKVYGDLGLTHCNYTLSVTPKAGGETVIVMPDGKALSLYERQSDGSWKIVYDCYNSNAPPAVE